MTDSRLFIRDDISRALSASKPIVALESTVIAHGLPFPLNLETARASEDVIRKEGAAPATIGVVEGRPTIGLSEQELERFALGRTEDNKAVHKVGMSNLAGVLAKGAWGATTVASTLRLAHAAGLKVFSTGGIGGVHRQVIDSFDISGDLAALARYPLVCVCAGAKAILDLSKTLEQLETLGVPVIGYCTTEFPAFYSRSSGLPVDVTANTPDEAADIALLHWQSGGATSVLVSAPVPEQFEIPFEVVDRAVGEATSAANRQGIRGKALTPFLLSHIKESTEGKSLEANRALLINNAEIAARISVSIANKILSDD